MDEQHNPYVQNWSFPPQPPVPPAPFFPTGKKEFLFGLFLLVTGWLLCNSLFYGGLNLGFAIFSSLALLCSMAYLLAYRRKLTFYTGALLAMCLVLCASFARSDDGFVKFICLCFLILAANLGLCLLAGQNRRPCGGISSLLDIPRTVFMLGLGKLPPAFRGLRMGVQRSGSAGKTGGAVLLGLVIAVPVLAVVIPLLISADAAFDALLQLLPDWDITELFVSVLFGSLLAVFLYARGSALQHAPTEVPGKKTPKGLHPLTVNTVLIAVGFVYGVYLISQLAYFSGGFLGILPQGYSTAEYARRGFFEMAWLCAVNLLIVALSMGLVRKDTRAPMLTRLICLFIGMITLFLVVSASAKMFLYIDTYGLTRLRLLTQVIIFFFGLATVVVSTWLFLPKLPYMKAVFLIALVVCGTVAWADVDTVVARYNVRSYQTGQLETIDVQYLYSLGYGAVPYVAQLTRDADPQVAVSAQHYLRYREFYKAEDFRGWNYVNHAAKFHVIDPTDDSQAQ